MAKRKPRYIAMTRLSNQRGEHTEPGEPVSLEHLDLGMQAWLLEMGVVEGPRPVLPVEAAGVPHEGAIRLWQKGIQTLETLAARTPAYIAMLTGVAVQEAVGWRDAALAALDKSQEPEQGPAEEGSTDG